MSYLQKIDSLDRRLTSNIHRLVLGCMDYIVIIPCMAFGTKFMPITIICAGLLFGMHLFITTVIASIVTVLVTEIMKKVTKRPRPPLSSVAERLFEVRVSLTNFAFPSGDSAQAAAFAGTLLVHITTVSPEAYIEAYCIATAIMFSAMFGRMYFGCHWLGDTIVGVFIGFFLAFNIAHALRPMLPPDVHILA